MSGRIEADWMTLLGQASSTANHYLYNALSVIEDICEKPIYAKLAPELRLDLAVRLAEIAARDLHSSAISVLGDKFSDALNAISSALEHSEE